MIMIPELNKFAVSAPCDFRFGASTVTFDCSGIFPSRKVLYKIQDGVVEPLSIVSEDFKFEPDPAKTFDKIHGWMDDRLGKGRVAADYALQNGTCLYSARQFSLAETVGAWRITPYILVSTAVDGASSTQARFVLVGASLGADDSWALNIPFDRGTGLYTRVTHHRGFEIDRLALTRATADKRYKTAMAKLKAMAESPVKLTKLREYFEGQLFDPKREAHDQTWGKTREVERLLDYVIDGVGDRNNITAMDVAAGVCHAYTENYANRESDLLIIDTLTGALSDKKHNMVTDLYRKSQQSKVLNYV